LEFFVFAFPVLISNLILLVIMGVPIMALEVSAITLFQNVTEDRFRGRVFGIYGTISGVLLLIGRGFATLVGGQVNVPVLLAAVGLLYIPTGLLAFRLLRERTSSKAPVHVAIDEIVPAGAQPTAGA
jgi:hypothetical protein